MKDNEKIKNLVKANREMIVVFLLLLLLGSVLIFGLNKSKTENNLFQAGIGNLLSDYLRWLLGQQGRQQAAGPSPTCQDEDGVCPKGCTPENDNDCFALAEIETLLGIDINYTGDESNLEISFPQHGVYRIEAKEFSHAIGPYDNEELDRYEINFPRRINHIYGLGRLVGANQVEVSDFLDLSFGNGHIITPEQGYDYYEADIGRMRTPIFVLPTENIIILYAQPALKKLRLTRTDSSTTVVLKKDHLDEVGTPAPLVIIKGDSAIDTYRKYYDFLKSEEYFFKKPHYKTFGIHWETWNEFGCQPTKSDIENIVSRYNDAGIKLSTVTLGSGYWGDVVYEGSLCPQNLVGCGVAQTGCPATDALTVSESNFGGKVGIDSLFTDLLSQDIYPMIGMRHQIQLGTEGFDNIGRINKKFAEKGVTDNIYLDNVEYYGSDAEHKVRFLNVESPRVLETWLDFIWESYGDVKGFKEDDMQFTDQKRIDSTATNLFDGLFSKPYQVYSQKTGNDFVTIGSSAWISVSNDAQSVIGWLPDRWKSDFSDYGGYAYKDFLDCALSQVVSGYPHPKSELSNAIPGTSVFGPSLNIPENRREEFTRLHQLFTFFPATLYSRGFWHVCPDGTPSCKDNYEDIIIFYAKLRNRLHQYAYDQAQRWYKTGIPWLMQPLFIRFPDNMESYEQYQQTINPLEPRDEYMFGNAMLVRPVFTNEDTVSVYLPPGRWKPFLSSPPYDTVKGPGVINFTISHPLNYPVFLKEGEILIIGRPDNPDDLMAYVFLEDKEQSSVYNLYYPHNNDPQITPKIHLQAYKSDGKVYLKNLDTDQSVKMTDDPYGKGLKVADIGPLISICQDGDGICPKGCTPENDNDCVRGDLDRTGQVNIDDIKVFIDNPNTPGADLNDDEIINGLDYLELKRIIKK